MSQTTPIPTVFEYNGHSYEFDLRDADDAAKYEAAIDKMGEVEKTLPKIGKTSEILRAQCKMLKTFFDETLGEGAGDALCTEKSNVAYCYAAYDAFLAFIRNQKDDVINTKNVFAKYSNREQRRAAAKKK